MSTDFTGQIAIVTGAAAGIGHTVAARLAEQGARIVGVDIAPALADAIGGLPGEGHLAVSANIADASEAAGAVDRVVAEIGAPTILVNSAGIGRFAPGEDLSEKDWSSTLAVNLSGSFFMAQAAGRAMLEAGYGRIVNIVSQAAEIGLPEHAAYSASKAGVLGFTRVLAVEWADRGVTINAISPTIADTALAREIWVGEKGENARAQIPAGRFVTPEEIASLALFLAGKDSAMITGENVRIDGGRSVI
ncbi:MAG: GolD/DthD family dehydrogenase [Brachybacterium sp.]|uniref:GolD/DthD family dehydrogenase n=1 Tax=Brachybacterium tyrofermentans TaxID=47848 RepID=A0ABW0FD93_9MICO|nr:MULTISPECIES: D-threitol dehydrogenase [Brachybacterium]MDN5599542.1 D-threitol dehydrogenase [Brachybacterium sp.]MDN6301659.1 D-threitol dehydrogenase [Brachybacterium sp.]PCC35360.1 D-threitol dehydrogenase [Brachybacterium alimentarium]RCS64926.1 D-threitol dehydrogenase [Brachybacterium alimentarium]RCS65153.1 D-threitol dehydrogenase [Brachybacterium sp. JB7]